MTLVDILEMFCDWCAANERHESGDILASVDKNQPRFEVGEVLSAVFRNTAKVYGMGKGSGQTEQQ